MNDTDRNGFLSSLRSKTGKAPRPEPSELDSLGNKKPSGKPARKSITVWLDEEAIKQFKVIAAEEDKEIQELMAESFNRTFAHYNKPQIA